MCYTCINKGRGQPKKNPQPQGRKDNTMTNEMLTEWLELYTELIGEADLMSQRGFTQKAAEIYAKAEGMREALEIFGYTVDEQYNEKLDGCEISIVKA